MKIKKTLVSLIAVVLVVVAMAVPAFAAGVITETIKIDEYVAAN